MTRLKYGAQGLCTRCRQDIEFHGRKAGWIDRGGNRQCTAIEVKPWEFVKPPRGTKHTIRNQD